MAGIVLLLKEPGALAGDFHRILSNGGMFMYPAIVNHPKPEKNRPQGKFAGSRRNGTGHCCNLILS